MGATWRAHGNVKKASLHLLWRWVFSRWPKRKIRLVCFEYLFESRLSRFFFFQGQMSWNSFSLVIPTWFYSNFNYQFERKKIYWNCQSYELLKFTVQKIQFRQKLVQSLSKFKYSLIHHFISTNLLKTSIVIPCSLNETRLLQMRLFDALFITKASKLFTLFFFCEKNSNSMLIFEIVTVFQSACTIFL